MAYSDIKLKEIFDYVQENGEQAASEYFNIKFASVIRRVQEYRQRFKDTQRPGQDKYDFDKITKSENKNEIELTLDSHEVRTIDELLAFSKIDTNIWEVYKSVTNVWGSPANPNHQIKAWLRRKESTLDIEKTCNYIIEKLSKYSKPSIIKYTPDKEGLLWEVGLVDHHLGELAWFKEVGFNYDIKLAKGSYEQAVIYLINKIKGQKISKILYHFGQDFFNVNSQFNTTVAGTPKDEEGRWQKTFDIGLQIHFETIQRLKLIAPIHALCVVGNHDEERIYYVGAALKGMFTNDKNVFIDNEPRARKYFRFGENLLGFTHLKDTKIDRLFNLMPVEAKEEWSKTKNWEWHCGHPHHETKKILNLNIEESSIRIRTLPTLATIDAWHYRHGYLSQRETQSFLWHPIKGNISQENYRP